MTSSFYTNEELIELGFGSLGENVLISRKASFYSPEKMCFGNNVRIDDFCVLSGTVVLGNYVHIAAGALLYGHEAGITFEDYSTISSRGAVYAVSDDYSGEHMTNPTVPEEYLGLIHAPVHVGKHVIIGTGSTVLPGVCLGEGCSVGAMSLVNKDTEPWKIYAGIPAAVLRDRSRNLLELCRIFEEKND